MSMHSSMRWLIGLSLCFLGFIITPERMIQVGAMGTSLTADHEMTRALAHFKVGAFRVVLVIIGLVVIFVVPRLTALGRHPRISPLIAPLPASLESQQQTFFNWALLAVILSLCAMIASVLVHPKPMALTLEDGTFEQLTALAFFVAALIGGWACYRRGLVWRTFPLALLTLFFFVAAGEELSWGQRFFGYQTPATIEYYNVQNEANLHNLFGYAADHLFIAGVFLFGAVVPVVCAKWPEGYRLMWRLGLPVASLGLAMGFLMLSLLHDWTIGRMGSSWNSIRVAEMRELAAGLAFLLLALETFHADSLHARAPALCPEVGGTNSADTAEAVDILTPSSQLE